MIEKTLIQIINSGLNPRKVLSLISCQRGMQMNELSRELGLSTAAVTGIADDLEKEHYLERVITKHDRRSFTLKTTRKGVHFLQDNFTGFQPS